VNVSVYGPRMAAIDTTGLMVLVDEETGTRSWRSTISVTETTRVPPARVHAPPAWAEQPDTSIRTAGGRRTAQSVYGPREVTR
jgi:hypothetical protein